MGGVRGGWPLRISHVASYNVHYKLQTSSSYLLYYYYYHYVCMCILSVKRNRTLKKSRNFICFIFILIVFSFATPTFPPRRCLLFVPLLEKNGPLFILLSTRRGRNPKARQPAGRPLGSASALPENIFLL